MFSVVVPAWNAERTLRECVKSVLVQSYDAFQLIVIDDGSTDQGLSVLEDISDSRLRTIRRERAGPGPRATPALKRRWPIGSRFWTPTISGFPAILPSLSGSAALSPRPA